MGDKIVGLNRLGLWAKANGFAPGERVLTELQTNLRKEYGDSFSRVGTSELAHVRDKVYAPGADAGTVKLLDLMIKTLGSPMPDATDALPARAALSSEPRSIGQQKDSTAHSQIESAASLKDRATALLNATCPSPSPARVQPISLHRYHQPLAVMPLLIAGDPNKPLEFTSAVWSEDGGTLRCVDRSYSIHEVDGGTGEVTRSAGLTPVKSPKLEYTYKRLTQDSKIVYCLQSPNPDAGTVGTQANLYAWDADTGELLTEVTESGTGLRWRTPGRGEMRAEWLSEDGARFVAAFSDGRIIEHDLDSGEKSESQCPGCEFFEVSRDGSAFLGEGSRTHQDGDRVITEEGTRAAHLFLRGPGGYAEVALEDAALPDETHDWLAGFSENGAYAALCLDGEGFRVWDTKTGKVRRVQTGKSLTPGGSAISNDGRVLAVLLATCEVQLYDITKGVPLGEPIPVGETGGGALSFSPDSKRLLVKSCSEAHRLIVFAE